MNSSLIMRNIGRFILLMGLQILVFNNIYLGGYITPCIYLLFIAMLPTNTGKIATLIISFGTGLIIDIFTNMAGFHTFACTAAGFLRIIWLDKIILHDNDEEIETPSIRNGSYQQFAVYLFLLLLAFNLIYHTLLIFDMREFFGILISALLSTLVTWILSILYQTILIRDKKN
ncbi:MAG: hypothetical protein J6Y98_05910 [Bacteroidales bacterium]|nr:hypothetical protein [Bacteroidales bacterium]